MDKIKFSHAYKKLLGTDGQPIKTAKLLLVLTVPMESLSDAKEFIDYDTDNGKYKITFSTFYLLLIFQKPSGDLFTTVRPQFGRFGSKKMYYESLVGKDIQIVLNEPSDA
jgi:hypothetical protein